MLAIVINLGQRLMALLATSGPVFRHQKCVDGSTKPSIAAWGHAPRLVVDVVQLAEENPLVRAGLEREKPRHGGEPGLLRCVDGVRSGRRHHVRKLLQVGSNRIEHSVEVRTDELHGHDDGYRDTSGDKAILNSGGTRFVLCETSDQFHVRRSC
jgi:hypothetical protein